MFEDVSGFGAWQRLFFKLEGGFFFFWNHPNEMGSKVKNSTAYTKHTLQIYAYVSFELFFFVSSLSF